MESINWNKPWDFWCSFLGRRIRLLLIGVHCKHWMSDVLERSEEWVLKCNLLESFWIGVCLKDAKHATLLEVFKNSPEMMSAQSGNCCQKKEVPEHKMMEYIAYLVPRPVYDNISTSQLHCLHLDANAWAVKLALNPKYYKIPLKQNNYHLVNHLIYLICVVYIYIFPKRVRYGKKTTSWLIHPSFWRQGPSFITWCLISRWEDFNCTGR